MTSSKKRRYDNKALHTPIQLSGLRAVPIDTEYDPLAIERTEKMDILLDAYGIAPDDPDGWYKLAYSLASDYVSGFKRAKRGRPGKWKGQMSLELYADGKMLMLEGQTARGACRILASLGRFKIRYGGESGDNLYRRYQEAPDKMYVFMRHIIEEEKANGIPFDKSTIRHFALREK